MSAPAPAAGGGILEVADMRVTPGRGDAFEPALRLAIDTVLSQAQGYRGCEVQRGIESPDRFLVLIRWDTVENHTVDFRQGPLFAQWRAHIGPFFAGPPAVEHFVTAAAAP